MRVLRDQALVRQARVEPLLQVRQDQPGQAGLLHVAVDGLLRDRRPVQRGRDALAEARRSLYGALVRFRNRPMVPPGGNQYMLCAGSRSTYVCFTSGRKLYDQSNLPLVTSSWLVAWLLAWAGKTTARRRDLRRPSSSSGFFFSVYWVGANESSVNGPVPTGLVLAYFAGSRDRRPDVLRHDRGLRDRGGERARSADLNVNVTCCREAETPVICDQTPLPSSAGYFFSRSKVKTTSAGRERLAVAPLDAAADRVDERRRVGELVPGGEERRVGAVDRAGGSPAARRSGRRRAARWPRERVEVLHQRRVAGVALDGQRAARGRGGA